MGLNLSFSQIYAIELMRSNIDVGTRNQNEAQTSSAHNAAAHSDLNKI